MHFHKTTASVSESDELAQQTAEWLVRLSADDMAPSVYAAVQIEFEQWKQADPKHADAVKKMEAIIQQTKRLRDTTTHIGPVRAAIETVF